jgi:hypothetical protein
MELKTENLREIKLKRKKGIKEKYKHFNITIKQQTYKHAIIILLKPDRRISKSEQEAMRRPLARAA